MTHHKSLGRLGLLVLLTCGAVACAQAGRNGNNNGGNGDGIGAGGAQDASVGGDQPDLAVPMVPIDFSGIDLYGIDLRTVPPADLSMECNVVAQSGCGVNEKCTYESKTASCITDGTKPTGSLCGPTADDCVHGNLCTKENASLFECRQFCNADSDCKQAAAPGGAANIAHCLVTFTDITAKVCTVACNPVSAAGASGCGAGLGCQLFTTATIPEATDCSVVGAGQDGADCTTNNNADCAAGFTCVGVVGSTVSHCRRVCRQGMAGTDCAGLAGYACRVATGTTMFGFCCAGSGC